MFVVIRRLNRAAAQGFVYCSLHRIGLTIGIQDGAAVEVAGAAADGLNQRAAGTQESFLVGIQNGNERDFRQVEAFAQKIDSDQYIELAFAQVAENLYALQRLDLRVHIPALHAYFRVVLGEVLRHPLGERCD